MEIEFIKKCVAVAPGWNMNDDQLIFPEGGIETLTTELLGLSVWKKVWEPLLMTQAIEGINREVVKDPVNISIKQFSHDIVVDCSAIGGKIKHFFYRDYDNETDAKAAALQWIFDDLEAPG